jgi:para-nitrobenzyl esterase
MKNISCGYVVLGWLGACAIGGCAAADGPLESTGTVAQELRTLGTNVETDKGTIQGTLLPSGTALSYLGIPYGAPPIGSLRWQPTAAQARWSGVRPATALGPLCVQPVQTPAGVITSVIGSEDCLYLNVYAPANLSANRKRPVIVWLHGGGNFNGSSISRGPSDPTIFATQNDAVFVNFNYRIGVMGFLAHPALDATSSTGTSGNYALHDQVAALEWVQRNIARFGGDPRRVTLVGFSTGATNAAALAASPRAEGLFSGTVMLSLIEGGVLPTLAAYEAGTGATIVNSVNTSTCGSLTDDLALAACLRAAPADTLVRALAGNSDNQPRRFSPNVDGHFLEKSPIDLIAEDRHHVPFVVGSDTEETSRRVTPPIATVGEYEASVNARYGTFGADAVAAILAAYPVGSYASPQAALVQVTTDELHSCPVRAMARAGRMQVRAGRGRKHGAFRYVISRGFLASPAQAPFGAFHGSAEVYAWAFGPLAPYTPPPEEQAISIALRQSFVNLGESKGRSPAGDSVDEWPMYEFATDPYLDLGVPITTRAGYRTEKCDLWDNIFDRPSYQSARGRNARHCDDLDPGADNSTER